MKNITTFLTLLILFPLQTTASEIHDAAAKGDIKGVRAAIKGGEELSKFASDPLSEYEWPKGTALHWAVRRGHLEVAKFLIKKGSDVNKETYTGDNTMTETALEYASFNNDYKMAKMLLDMGADVEGSGHNFYWPLYSASRHGNLKLMKLYISAGADLNRTGVDGHSALHSAIEKGQFKAVKLLIENKIDPNLVGMHRNMPMGSNPLQYAKEKGKEGIIKYLEKNGAKDIELNTEILLGVLEESYLVKKGKLQARILFVNKGENKWTTFGMDEIETNSKKINWHIAFDGKNLGRINTTETDSSVDYDKTFNYTSRHTIVDVSKSPKIKNKHSRFAGWNYTPKNRPLVILSKPNYKDGEKWKRARLDNVTPYIEHLKKLIKTAYKCEGAPKYNIHKIEIKPDNLEIFKAYKNTNGEKIISVGIAKKLIKECEVPVQIDLAPHWFYVGDAVLHIGSNIDLIDAGDYDADNKVEFLFWYSGYNHDGYMLFENNFSKKFIYDWKYH